MRRYFSQKAPASNVVCPSRLDFFPHIQAKLSINQPGDRYEQEADHVADQIMRIPTSSVTESLIDQQSPVIQRKQNETQSGGSRQRSSSFDGISNSGDHMTASNRAFFEPRFGKDFSEVRIHDNAQANMMADQINARAFTFGSDIVFSQGQYQPDTQSGQRLLAHELTHVVQQQGMNQNKIQRDVKPWQEVNAVFGRGSRRIHLFNHAFGRGTSLTSALQWIYVNSIARASFFDFVAPEDDARTSSNEAAMEAMGLPLDSYQEVALVWNIRTRRFTAYTRRDAVRASTDPRQSANNILVAHTHPTQQQVTGGRRSMVQWVTNMPSNGDTGRFHQNQSVSIICHQDPADPANPMAFIYDRSGSVLSRYSGANAFASAANEFLRLEREHGTLGSGVGQYRRGRRSRSDTDE
ncbi:MAG: DUF4157 domain-containing protein [Gammaproteobacteria bacterium]|nr:DUF4157 domain-containing protein [Gammaproteobacteria bacterium]